MELDGRGTVARCNTRITKRYELACEGAVRSNMAGRTAVGLVSGLTFALCCRAGIAVQRQGAVNGRSTSENHPIYRAT